MKLFIIEIIGYIIEEELYRSNLVNISGKGRLGYVKYLGRCILEIFGKGF